ncbi:unnamed protein product [Mesocestoides corti]|uniref:Adenosine deaminase n=1 Tax=Mesocestoides corti TaxID=53468 RepID=A0A0R3UHM7_MESCO|nr:unnamed protein product [Mesocestoides corti]
MHLDGSRHAVELHLHVDGSFRPSTMFQIAKHRGLLLPAKSSEEFSNFLKIHERGNLPELLSKFDCITPIVAGDEEAISQCMTDFLEDCVKKSHLCYVEARLAPHLLVGGGCSVEQVVKTVLEAMLSAATRFNIESRLILTMLRHQPQYASEVISLAKAFQPHGVCAIDLAGDDTPCDGTNTDLAVKEAFREAYLSGVHRTVHAGVDGPSASVREAIYDMFAERIGHGYHVIDDPALYMDVLEKNIHFEMCPLSGWLSGSVPESWRSHPIIQFFGDQGNVSINTDDPTLTGQWRQQEIAMCLTDLGLTSTQIERANINAAQAAFLADVEKEELLGHIAKALGFRTIRD